VAKSGFTALKAEPLAKAMGVSRGSFYWHFADLSAFHAAVLKQWREIAAEAIFAGVEASAAHENPLAVLLRRVFGERLTLENAVRIWASVDPTARAAVQAIDRRRLSYGRRPDDPIRTICGYGARPRPDPLLGRSSALRSRTSRCRRRSKRHARGDAADGGGAMTYPYWVC